MLAASLPGCPQESFSCFCLLLITLRGSLAQVFTGSAQNNDLSLVLIFLKLVCCKIDVFLLFRLLNCQPCLCTEPASPQQPGKPCPQPFSLMLFPLAGATHVHHIKQHATSVSLVSKHSCALKCISAICQCLLFIA